MTGALPKLFSYLNRDSERERMHSENRTSSRSNDRNSDEKVRFNQYRSNDKFSAETSRAGQCGSGARNSAETSGYNQYRSKFKDSADTSRSTKYRPNDRTPPETIPSTPHHCKTERSYAEKKSYAEDYKDYIQYYNRFKDGHFDCNFCENRLSNRQSLIYHMIAVHGKSSPSYLRPQISRFPQRLITQFKSKVCIICSRTFASHESLRSHLARRHDIQMYNCAIGACAQVFLHQKNLAFHLLENHSMVCNESVGTTFFHFSLNFLSIFSPI